MRYHVTFSPEAEQHLDDIEQYLAKRFFPANAERFVRRLILACHSLAEMPHRGAKCPELAPSMRHVGFENKASIYFTVLDREVSVIGICYRGRKLDQEP